MKRIALVAMLMLFVSVQFVNADGTVTTPTTTNGGIKEFRANDGVLYRYIKWPWESTGGTATVSGGTIAQQGYATNYGEILQCWSNHASGADDNFDIEIRNAYDLDVLDGDGANLPADMSDETCRFTPLNDQGDRIRLFGDSLSFYGTNMNTAGDASGEFWMLIRVYEGWF